MLTFSISPGGPEILDEESLAENVGKVLASSSEEQSRNPGSGHPSHLSSSGKSKIDSSGIAKMKEKFAFLRDYSDSFIEQAGLEVLIKAESVSRKMSDQDRSRKAEDKLLANRGGRTTGLTASTRVASWRAPRALRRSCGSQPGISLGLRVTPPSPVTT